MTSPRDPTDSAVVMFVLTFEPRIPEAASRSERSDVIRASCAPARRELVEICNSHPVTVEHLYAVGAVIVRGPPEALSAVVAAAAQVPDVQLAADAEFVAFEGGIQ